MVRAWREIDWLSEINKYGTVPKSKKTKSKEGRDIFNIYTAFDIETSTIWIDEDHSKYDVHAFMYSWAFQFEDITILGREWDDFFNFLTALYSATAKYKREQKLTLEPRFLIWVHNLAYEFTFLSYFYKFRDDECFFRDVRKPIYCRINDIFEFRCSYIQSNLSLKMLCKQTGVPEKLSGQKFNYDKVRFPWTELTDYELSYIITDVESLVLAMKKRVSMNGDNLITVPLTSTGYVRRECKASLKGRYYDITEMKPKEQEYRLLRQAFRGG